MDREMEKKMKNMRPDERIYGLNDKVSNAPGENISAARYEAYVKMLMQRASMSREEAISVIEEKTLQGVIDLLQGHPVDELDKNIQSLRDYAKKKKSLMSDPDMQ